jgi:hypothetical protein
VTLLFKVKNTNKNQQSADGALLTAGNTHRYFITQNWQALFFGLHHKLTKMPAVG